MSTAVPLHHPTHRRDPWPDTTVIAWRDPVVEGVPGAVATTSDDVLIWWPNSLGPTSILMARHLATYASERESVWSLDDLAGTLGVMRSVAARTLDRLTRFGVIARHGSTVAVRLMLPPLTARQRERLPRYLADAYHPS